MVDLLSIREAAVLGGLKPEDLRTLASIAQERKIQQDERLIEQRMDRVKHWATRAI